MRKFARSKSSSCGEVSYVISGSVTETAGCLRTVVVWEGEAPAEPGAWVPHPSPLAKGGGRKKTLGDHAVYPFLTLAARVWGIRANSVMVGSAHPTRLGNGGQCPPYAAPALAMDTPYGSPSRRPRRNCHTPVISIQKFRIRAGMVWQRHLAGGVTGWKPVPHKPAGTPIVLGSYSEVLFGSSCRRG
jgi:hypothetical protein